METLTDTAKYYGLFFDIIPMKNLIRKKDFVYVCHEVKTYSYYSIAFLKNNFKLNSNPQFSTENWTMMMI